MNQKKSIYLKYKSFVTLYMYLSLLTNSVRPYLSKSIHLFKKIYNKLTPNCWKILQYKKLINA